MRANSLSSPLTRWLIGILFVLLSLLVLRRLLETYRDFTLPREITYPNSVMVYHAREFQNGRPIYRDFRERPHVLGMYGPFFYILPGWVGRWFDSDEFTMFRIGRALSILATLGSIITVLLLLRHERVGPWLIAVMTLIYVAADPHWPAAFRPDPWVTLCVLLGLLVCVLLQKSRWLALSLPLFVTAFLFKQSAIVAPVAITIWLVLDRRRGTAVFFAALTLIGYGAAFLIANHLTDGLYYLNAFIGMKANVTLGNLSTVVGETVLRPCLIPLGLALAGVVRRWRAREFDIYSLYFVLSFCMACAGTIRDGSAHNYFVLPIAVACLIGGQELARWLPTDKSADDSKPSGTNSGAHAVPTARSPIGFREAAHAVLLISIVFYLPPAARSVAGIPGLFDEINNRAERDEVERDFFVTLARQLDELDGPILCQFDTLNLLCKKAVLMDPFAMTSLADQGVLDDSQIIDDIRAKRIAAIVLQFPLRPGNVPKYQSTAWVREEWLSAALKAGYQESRASFLYIYTP
jgi:hypothetical protein